MTNIITKAIDAYGDVNLMVRIIIGLIIGAVLGVTMPGIMAIEMLGLLFVGSLEAIAPVLVAVLVASSLAKARKGLGSRFTSVIILYVSSMLVAAIAAVVVSMACPISLMLPEASSQAAAAPTSLSDVFINLAQEVVSNPLKAIMEGKYLSILVWSIIIGTALKHSASEKTIDMVHDFADTISLVVHWIINCAPFGILGLVYAAVSDSGLEIFTTYGKLLMLLVGCMLLSLFVINPLIVGITLRRNPYPLLWQCIKGSAVNAFFTRSSAANIPVNMALCKRLGLDEDFYSISIPLGSTINMNGAAVTITVMTLATCHTMGVEVSFGSAIVLSVLSVFAACGTSGVAGGSLLLVPMACSLFGISPDVSMQVVAIGFIISVVQDSLETALNSSGDVLYTATADFYERGKHGEKITSK